VNSVLPGPTETESLKSFISSVNSDLSYADAERKFIAENRRSSLIYRLPKPHQVANVIAFLASERAAVSSPDPQPRAGNWRIRANFWHEKRAKLP
jgi:3-oxoacyl-[acyl-carrier protein] reductase